MLLASCATPDDGAQKSPASARPDDPASTTSVPAPAPQSTRASASAVVVDATGGEDPAVLALLEPHRAVVAARASRVLATLAVPLDRGARGAPESTLGNFVADAMRTSMSRATGAPVDVCFTNMGGLRRDLGAGPVTEGDVLELMPFDNMIVVFVVDGAALQSLLDHVAERGDPMSGARFARKEKRAVDVAVGTAPLDPARVYRVCTNDYVYDGGSDYTIVKSDKADRTGVLLRDAIKDELERAQGAPVRVAMDGRVRD